MNARNSQLKTIRIVLNKILELFVRRVRASCSKLAEYYDLAIGMRLSNCMVDLPAGLEKRD